MSEQQQPEAKKPENGTEQVPVEGVKTQAPGMKPGETDGLPSIHIYFDKPGNLKMDFKNANIYTIIGMLEASRKRIVGSIGSGPRPSVEKPKPAASGAKA